MVAVSNVAQNNEKVEQAKALLPKLQEYGFLGKAEKNGTIGINIPGLNNAQITKLADFAFKYEQTVEIKRTGGSVRITLRSAKDYFKSGPSNPNGTYVNFTTLKQTVDKNGNTGFNIQRIYETNFVALINYRRELGQNMTIKRSGAGLRFTITN